MLTSLQTTMTTTQLLTVIMPILIRIRPKIFINQPKASFKLQVQLIPQINPQTSKHLQVTIFPQSLHYRANSVQKEPQEKP